MIKVFHRAVLFLFICSTVFSQKLLIEVDTEEGRILQLIDGETDATKKVTLLEHFAKTFPNHEAGTWVLGQLQSCYLAGGQLDKALELGARLLILDPGDVSAAHNGLKAAEAKKDVELIKLWSAQASQAARKVKELKKPEEAGDVEEWKQKVEYAKQVDQYSEYALYSITLQSKDSRIKAKLIESLEQKNPNSEYLAQLRTAQTQVVRQVDIEEAVAAAETAFARGEYNVDSLMMTANHLMSRRRDPEKVIAYSTKLVEMLNKGSKPADRSDADWNRAKHQMLGTANWMIGLLYSTQERFGAADRTLRQALPDLKNSDMVAGALYHLGYVNFRLAEAGDRIRIHDAVRFTSECIAIDSAVQRQAIENLKSMKAEYNLP